MACGSDILRIFLQRDHPVEPEKCLNASEVFCMAPWSHIHVLPSGKIYACCMSAHAKKNAIGDLHKGDTLEGAWNSRKMRKLRRQMLMCRESGLCERCYIAEKNDQGSLRKSVNFLMAHHFDWVHRTSCDGFMDVFKVPYLDIRFSNLCNFRCRICSPYLSSGWYRDARKLWLIRRSMPKVLNVADGNPAFLSKIFELLEDVECIQFGGGEPLIMEEHYQILERLMKLRKYDVRLSYNTNCSVIQHKQYNLLEMWNGFNDVFIMASLDGSHGRGDYMRKGQHWEVTEENIRRIRRECPRVRFRLSPTISLFNAFHLIDFYKELYEKGTIHINEFATNILLEPSMYNIRNFPEPLKARLTCQYNEFIATYLTDHNASEETKNHFRAVIQYMNEESLHRLFIFKAVTRILDKLRNESFPEVFPELGELLK